MRTKPIVAALIAVGMTLTLAGTAQSSTVSQDRELRISSSTDSEARMVAEKKADDREARQAADTRATDSRKKCISKKKIKKIRLTMPVKKVKKLLGKPVDKNPKKAPNKDSLWFWYYNSCISSNSSDLDITFTKPKKKWKVSYLSVYLG